MRSEQNSQEMRVRIYRPPLGVSKHGFIIGGKGGSIR